MSAAAPDKTAPKKVWIETYGCQMNVADTELMFGGLQEAGYVVAERLDEADVILLNTCAVREKAEDRIYGRASQLLRFKYTRPDLVLGVTGCMAEHLKERIVEKAPYIDLVVGPDAYRRLPDLLAQASGDDPVVDVRLDKNETYEGMTAARGEGVSGWITIQRGCDKFCTFCIVPYTRGRERGTSPREVLRQARELAGMGYREVDYGANLNLLSEALRAGVPRFAYVHVLNAPAMAEVPLVAAKAAFVRALQSADIASTVIAPSGYFSDMADFLAMARSGRVWLFGSGAGRINPIHGADLAAATAEAIAAGRGWLDIGGPDILTQTELAQAAFAALGKPARITRLPDWVRRAALAVLPRITPRRIHRPAQFFLTALGHDMVGTPYGSRHLADHFAAMAETPAGQFSAKSAT